MQSGRSISSQEAAVGVLAAAEHMYQALGAVCARYGITTEQYRVLRVIGESPHARGEVAKHCPHRAPDVTRLLDRLARQGMVRRARDPEDRRCSVATITRKGRALLARIGPEIAAEMQRLTRPLSDPQLHQLIRITDVLVS